MDLTDLIIGIVVLIGGGFISLFIGLALAAGLGFNSEGVFVFSSNLLIASTIAVCTYHIIKAIKALHKSETKEKE